MLTITIPGIESFDDEKQEFVYSDSTKLEMEHSLVSLSKWESKYQKPFLGKDEKTTEEVLGYIEAMILTPDPPPGILQKLTEENVKQINEYIDAKMTATWFREEPNKTGSREIITAELIYYWMSALNISFECENWHLHRLFTFIRVVNAKNAPAKKMGRRDAAAQQREMNALRKAQMGTTG